MSGSWGGPTWSCAHVREQLGAYVLGGLEREEASLVAGHLATCPDCAALHRSLTGLPALLDLAAGLEVTPPRRALEERVLDAVARERGSSRRPRRARRRVPARARAAAAAALAGLAVGAVATALAMSGDDEPDRPVPAARARAHLNYDIVLHGRWGAKGRAALEPRSAGTVLHLYVKGLPAGADAVYEIRCEAGNWSASAGTFRADARGHAYVVTTTAARAGEYDRIRVVRRSHGRTVAVLSGRIS